MDSARQGETEPETPPAPRTQPARSTSRRTTALQHTYGYHNTFHTHQQLPLGQPPSYATATDPTTLCRLNQKALAEAAAERANANPPPYSCSVQLSGILGVRYELLSPFQVSGCRDWWDAYVILQGTQISIHRIKQPGLLSRNKLPTPGRLVATYSLQHAEVGVAADFRKTPLTPKSPFAHLVPVSARPKLYESDPHLFEPIREHALRLRLETEQLLLCAPTHESSLSWVEALCAAIDISPPLDDRSEPRYRSLPRRNRRQRVLDRVHLGDNLEDLSSLEAGRRVIAEQERIIAHMYPHLAAGARDPDPAPAHVATEPEADDFDPEDVRFPTRGPPNDMSSHDDGHDDDDMVASSSDPKLNPAPTPSPSQARRYRRRCAPVLLATSPRVSDVVFSGGRRLRISAREHALVEYTSHPPRYDVHGFPKKKPSSKASTSSFPSTTATITTTITGGAATAAKKAVVDKTTLLRPVSPIRGASENSFTSITFGYALAPSASDADMEIGVSLASSSGPPSPTALLAPKMDATGQLHMKLPFCDEARDEALAARLVL
jgi:hypothetical protein